ncbi:hypothetical protein J3R30DRAFT_3451165 [Lentinula aciculospora]|uniref:Aminoglycoside phosphotransferase domain-containing protein n=1 Tax=Lentinula aciculospora TaxID=153920 RepID=A0A9W9DSM6_9AGAR|nr:hypothetical protein J3R30DRAFT_3451165 [Lentinula aciculospora]
MWFRNILLHLVISASFWIFSVNALPISSSTIGISSNIITHSEQLVEDPWDKIRRWNLKKTVEQSWIKFKEECPGYGQNKKYFQYDMTGLSMKLLHSDRGGFNGGIYDFTPSADDENAGPNHIIKLVDLSQEYASCEPYALQAHNIWVQTGFIVDAEQEKWGALQMEKISGQPLDKYQLWLRRPSAADKKVVLEEVRDQLFKFVYSKAQEPHQLIHTDFNPNNVHVELKIENKRIIAMRVYLLDFGYPGVYATTKLPSEKEFRAWFDLRFDLLWDYIYEKAGEKPPHHMKYVALIDGEVVEVNGPSVEGKEMQPKESAKRKETDALWNGTGMKKQRLST